MLSSIIEFAILRRAVAKQAAGQQVTPPPARVGRPEAATEEDVSGFEMSILKRESMFEDAPGELGGSLITICF